MNLDKDFYDPDYDSEADHYETPKCNHCGDALNHGQIDGDVCQTCYEEE